MTIIINNNKQEDITQKINKNLFETFFSFGKIKNNLIYLNINFEDDYNINPDLFKNINNFKILRFLYMNSFKFDKNCTIKLKTLKLLSIKKCKNIELSKMSNEK